MMNLTLPVSGSVPRFTMKFAKAVAAL
jgi:hypothetical protein